MDPMDTFLAGVKAKVAQAHDEGCRAMRLGELIAALEPAPPTAFVRWGPGMSVEHAMSYRGYYSDLALAPTSKPATVETVLGVLRGALGQVFEGYKGGDFYMTARTPVWIAEYGRSDGWFIREVRVTKYEVYLYLGNENDTE